MEERIRDHRAGADDAELEALWQRVFGETRGGQTLDWLFRPGPAGVSPRAVAEVDGRIVAHAGAAAVRFRMNGEDVLGAYSVGAMTDPAHRGRGLWARLGQHLYSRLEREGFAFVAGFSNQNSHRLMSGPLQRRPLRPFPWCIRPLLPSAALLRRRAVEGRSAEELECGAGIRVRRVAPGDPRLDSVWKRAAEECVVGCVRDAAFTAWRYASRPDAGYRLLLAEREGEPAGYAVFRDLHLRGVRATFVMDFVLGAGEHRAGAALLGAVRSAGRDAGSLLLSALLPGHGTSRRVLRRAGFLRIPERFHPQLIRFSVRGFGRYASDATLVDPNAWHLSWADTDVV